MKNFIIKRAKEEIRRAIKEYKSINENDSNDTSNINQPEYAEFKRLTITCQRGKVTDIIILKNDKGARAGICYSCNKQCDAKSKEFYFTTKDINNFVQEQYKNGTAPGDAYVFLSEDNEFFLLSGGGIPNYGTLSTGYTVSDFPSLPQYVRKRVSESKKKK